MRTKKLLASQLREYQTDNVKYVNRREPAGQTEISGADYGYVIWRGQDVPTIAKYKYDGSTKQNTASDLRLHEKIINLIPEGKTPVGVRHPENGHMGGKGCKSAYREICMQECEFIRFIPIKELK